MNAELRSAATGAITCDPTENGGARFTLRLPAEA
jgi:hypothetical protein